MIRTLLALCGLVFSTTVLANVGSVAELTGTAVIKRGKTTVPVTNGTVVEMNDRVETKNGKLKIVFRDKTTVSVTESSALDIDEFVYDPKNAGAGKLGIKAAAGTVRYVSGAIAGANPNAVNIKTPTAAIAVRGTDFVMSVNEIGGSMIILMPQCEEHGINVRGMICGSGRIDVESGGTVVNMSRPYQATLVEKTGSPPSPPITVNLFNTPISNNLQIAPPRTMSGGSVVAAARAAVAQTSSGVRSAARSSSGSGSSSGSSGSSGGGAEPAAASDAPPAEAVVASESNKPETVASKSEETTTAVEAPSNIVSLEPVLELVTKTTESAKDEKAEPAPTVTTTETKSDEDANLRKIYSGASQSGWGYESLSKTSRNYANIVLPINTAIQIYIVQDNMVAAKNFSSGRPQGQIVINQTFR